MDSLSPDRRQPDDVATPPVIPRRVVLAGLLTAYTASLIPLSTAGYRAAVPVQYSPVDGRLESVIP